MRSAISGLVNFARQERGSELDVARIDGVVAHSFFSRSGALGIGKQEALAWLWVAGSLGHARAVSQIRDVLELDILQSHEEAGGVLSDMAASWDAFERELEVEAAMSDDVEAIDAKFIEGVEDPKGLSALRAAAGGKKDVSPKQAAPVKVPDAEHGLVVVEHIGDPTSREGVDLVNRYGKYLGVRLGYQGRPPALDIIRDGIVDRWPWAEAAAMQLETRFSLMRAGDSARVTMSPLLFVGPPGSGKSSIASWVCDAVGLHTITVSCGTLSDQGGFNAVSRGWATARPGRLATTMMEHRICNPAVILDEVEKTAPVNSPNGSVQAALVSMVTASSYDDTCLMAGINLAGVSFMATANSLKPLDGALLDRFEVVAVPGPTVEHFDALLQSTAQDFMTKHAIPSTAIPKLGAESMELLYRTLDRTNSARTFASVYERFVREAIHRREREVHQAMEAFHDLEEPALRRSIN